MTNKLKTEYTKIALALTGIAVSKKLAEMIWRTYEKIQEKKGNFNIIDAMEIEKKVTGTISRKKFSLDLPKNPKNKQKAQSMKANKKPNNVKEKT